MFVTSGFTVALYEMKSGTVGGTVVVGGGTVVVVGGTVVVVGTVVAGLRTFACPSSPPPHEASVRATTKRPSNAARRRLKPLRLTPPRLTPSG